MVSDSSSLLLWVVPRLVRRASEQGRSTREGKRPGALLPARGRNGDKAELLSEVNATGLNAELKRRSSASRNTWIEKCGGLDPKPRGWDPAPREMFPSHSVSAGRAPGVSKCFHMAAWFPGFGLASQVEDDSFASSTSCFFSYRQRLIGKVMSFVNPTRGRRFCLPF